MINTSEFRKKVVPIPSRSASRRALKQLVISLVLSLPILSFAQPIILIDNLFAPSTDPQGGIGDFHVVEPGTGYGVDFSTDGGSYSLNTLTVEFAGASLPSGSFDAQIYTVGATDPNNGTVNLVPYGQFGSPTFSPTATQWPGVATFINFSPTSPITLQPNTTYVIGCTEATTGGDFDALRFVNVPYTYSNPGGVNGDNYGYLASSPPNSPFQAGWTPDGGGDFVLRLTATEVPEPGSWALAAIAVGLAGAARRSFNRR